MATYSFLNVHAAITGPGGSFPLGSGVGAAEEGISFEMAEEKNTMTVGADGEGMHSMHAGKAAKITVRLLKTSPVNGQLSQMYDIQSQSSAVWGQNVITINDSARGDVIALRQAAFVKLPNVNYAKEGGVIEWEFQGIKADALLGSGQPEA
jgi:hypothetical protein